MSTPDPSPQAPLTKEETPLPCPFCGGTAAVAPRVTGGGRGGTRRQTGYTVGCDDAECAGWLGLTRASKADAVERWNRRSSPRGEATLTAPLVLSSVGHVVRCKGCGQKTDNAIDAHIGCCRSCYEIRRVHHVVSTLVTTDREKDHRILDAFEREHEAVLRGFGIVGPYEQIESRGAGGEPATTTPPLSVEEAKRFWYVLTGERITDSLRIAEIRQAFVHALAARSSSVSSSPRDTERLDWLDATGREHGRIAAMCGQLLRGEGVTNIREAIDAAIRDAKGVSNG